MFCIINLRHNSRYVASPAAGGPPFFTTHAPPRSVRRSVPRKILILGVFVYSRTRVSILAIPSLSTSTYNTCNAVTYTSGRGDAVRGCLSCISPRASASSRTIFHDFFLALFLIFIFCTIFYFIF